MRPCLLSLCAIQFVIPTVLPAVDNLSHSCPFSAAGIHEWLEGGTVEGKVRGTIGLGAEEQNTGVLHITTPMWDVFSRSDLSFGCIFLLRLTLMTPV